jgi:hypothetical protein
MMENNEKTAEKSWKTTDAIGSGVTGVVIATPIWINQSLAPPHVTSCVRRGWAAVRSVFFLSFCGGEFCCWHKRRRGV